MSSKASLRRLQDVLNMFLKCLQDVFKTKEKLNVLHVFKDKKLLRWRYLPDVFKQFETTRCLLGTSLTSLLPVKTLSTSFDSISLHFKTLHAFLSALLWSLFTFFILFFCFRFYYPIVNIIANQLSVLFLRSRKTNIKCYKNDKKKKPIVISSWRR